MFSAMRRTALHPERRHSTMPTRGPSKGRNRIRRAGTRTMASMRRSLMLLVILLLFASPSAFAQNTDAPLRVGPLGMIVRDGASFRGIGVNYHDAYVRTLLNPDDTSYEAGFAELGEKDIPFARISIMGYWPSWNTIFLEDREEALRRLDGVVQSAERHGVGLVFSVFWATFTVPDNSRWLETA